MIILTGVGKKFKKHYMKRFIILILSVSFLSCEKEHCVTCGDSLTFQNFTECGSMADCKRIKEETERATMFKWFCQIN